MLMLQHINTGDHSPICQPLRRKPFPLCKTKRLNEMVNEMLDMGIIKQSSSSWASPMVLIKKKDETMIFCEDYYKLNHITIGRCIPISKNL